MRRLYQISYDLKMPGYDYSPLYAGIKKLGEWERPLSSVWYVVSELSMNEIYDQLSKYVNSDTDKILILDIENRNITGLASDKFWDWIGGK